MLTQRLRHRVDIQEFSVSEDSNGESITESWESIRADAEPLIAAEVMPLSGREFVAAQAIQAGVTTRITIRYRASMRPTMRVLHEGSIYNIKAVLPDPKLRKHLTLMCESGVNDG